VLPAENGARDAVGGGFSANGVRSNGQNNFLLNGVDNNVNVIDFLNQTAYVIGPSVEAIGEMRILTNGYNASTVRGAGGVVNVQPEEPVQIKSMDLSSRFCRMKSSTRIVGNQNKAGKDRGPFKTESVWWHAGRSDHQKSDVSSLAIIKALAIASSGGSIQNLGYGAFIRFPHRRW